MAAAPIARKHLASLWAAVFLAYAFVAYTLLTNEPDELVAFCNRRESDHGEHVANAVSLQQQSQMANTASSATVDGGNPAPLVEEAAVSISWSRDQSCLCDGKSASELPSCRVGWGAASVVATPMSHAKPYRLRTVAIAVAGFGLLSLEPAMLLAF